MIKLPDIFADGMVLQGGVEFRVWGEADCGQVSVSIQGKESSAPVKDGKFEVLLPPLAYSARETLTLTGDSVLVLHDVAVGEVWLAAGQSNMEFQMCFDRDFPGETVGTGEIRHFGVPEIACPEALERFDYSDWGFWRKNDSRENLQHFTAVGYHFAKLLARHTGHTVGIINCSWGGTIALPWVEPSCLRGTPGELWIDEYDNSVEGVSEAILREEYLRDPRSARGKQLDDPMVREMLFGMSRETQEERMRQMPPMPEVMRLPYFDAPGRLYEAMVKTVAPYGIKGVLWYQGESDSVHPELYGHMLAGLIRSWRDLWRESLPFYVVQLPSFGAWMGCGGENFPVIRRMQEQTADAMEGVYMVSTMDCGMRWDIHPKKKKPVGERLARLALKKTYGYDLPAGSPRPVRMEARIGKITIHFSDAQGGLVRREELEGKDALKVTVNGSPAGSLRWEVSGETMVIGCEEFQAGCHVVLAYAGEGYDPVNVFNQAGFSLRPFTAEAVISQSE